MKAIPYILKEASLKSVKQNSWEVAVIPWGSLEAHNYHLPYGTDTYEAEHIASEAARLAWEAGARVIVLPCVPYGVNSAQMGFPLVMNMNPSTQAALLADLVDSLSQHGIRKIVVLNGHGGNDFRQAIREINPVYPGTFISTFEWYRVLDPSEYFIDGGDHAGEMETSVMMKIVPELVRPLSEAGKGSARKFRFRAMQEGWAWAERDWTSITEDSGTGNPAGATADKGEKYLADLTGKVAEYLVELASASPDDLYE